MFNRLVYFKEILKKILLILSLQLLCNCSGSKNSLEPNNQNIKYLITEGKNLWEQRADSNAMARAEYLISLAYKERTEDFELASLIGEMKYTRAYFLEKDPIKRDSLFYIGNKICRESVFNDPEFSIIFNQTKGDSTTKLFASIDKAPKTVVPRLYWWAVNLLHYLNNQPIIERLNQRELLEVIMNRVLALEPSFHFSGPYRFFGSLYTRIPGLNLNQSETYFNQSLTANPEFLGNTVLMAEFYYQKAGDREKFHKILNNVLKTNLTKNPELITYNLFYQSRAEELLENESSLFE